MKIRILIGLVVLAVLFVAFQVFQYVQLAQQAQNPLPPGQRFATHPGAPTEEEILLEEKRLEQRVQREKAVAK